ncbi:hypothetical protein MKW92_048816, partial [Papaver armeniacum]
MNQEVIVKVVKEAAAAAGKVMAVGKVMVVRVKNEGGEPFIDHSDEIPQEGGVGRRMEQHPHWDEEIDVAEYERIVQERYQRYEDYSGDNDEDNNDVEQQALLPSVKDPKLWIVKCAAAFCFMQKCIDQGHGMNIKSAIALDYLKNYACKGLKMLNTTKVMLVPIKEMRDVLVVVKAKPWISYRICGCSEDWVVNVFDMRQRVMVKLVPRVDLQAIADKLEGRKVTKKAIVPTPRLININEARKDEALECTSMCLMGKTFNKALDKELGGLVSMSTSIANGRKCPFMKGDAVIVVKGDLTNLMGWVEKVDEDNVHIRPKRKDLHVNTYPYKVIVNGENMLVKYFKPGDHVKVVSGSHEGATGMVITVNSMYSSSYLMPWKENIRVFADHARDSSEATLELPRIGDYELHDLVMLSKQINMSFGVIIRLESEALHILKGDPDRPEVVLVKLREIKYKIERKNTAQDRWKNTVSVKDVVKILMGPCKGKQGPVEHILKGILFIKDRHHMEHAGYICAKAQSCIVMGGSHSKVVSPPPRYGASRDLAHIPPSPRRCPRGGPPFNWHDSFVSSTIKIRVSNYKEDGRGCNETPQRGIGSETPMHRAQTHCAH